MTTFEVSVTKAMENAMATACRDVSLVLVGELAKEHGFEADAAIKSLGLDRFVTKRIAAKGKAKAEPKEVIKKPKFPLPLCGVANKCNCKALRLNHGLYTQCTQKPTKGMSYCKTCQKSVDRSATGKPTYGTIEDRMAVGVVDYVDPKGKRAVPYANVMEKLGITREAAEAEIKEFAELMGTDTIPDEHWTKREAKRGRPKKEVSPEDAQKKPKKRGRPAKKEVSGKDTDLISALQAAADSSDSESVASSSSSSRGRPRLSEEEKQRRAEEKAQKKQEKEAAKQKKAQEKAAAKAEAAAAKRQGLIDEITALNSEVPVAMDISTFPEDATELRKMLSDLKKQKKQAEKDAAKKEKAAAKQQAEQEAADKKSEAAAAAAAKRQGLIDEITTLATESGKTVTEFPDKIGDLRKMIAEMKREIREAKKQAKQESKPDESQTQESSDDNNSELAEEEEEDDAGDSDECEEFTHDGVTYLKGSGGVLYDYAKFKNEGEAETVGVWNDETKSIDPAPEEDSDEEDSDEEDSDQWDDEDDE